MFAPHPSLYFFLQFLFHLFLMSTLVPDENSMNDPLCNSSFGSMVSLDYVTPVTESGLILNQQNPLSLSAYEVSKKVVNLLRHRQTIQREDNGEVQFWRIKFYFRNQFPQNQYWSDDRWKICLAAGGGQKKKISVLL